MIPAANGPQAVIASSAPSIEQLETAFDNSIWYLLSLWPALHVACVNGWGGPDTADKKDWFAGAVSDLFTQRADTDQEDLEEFMLQVMTDEFDCNVEDGTEVEVAQGIMQVRARLLEERTLEASREVELRWRNRGQMKHEVQITTVNQDVEEDGEGYAGVAEEESDDDMEAPTLVSAAPSRPKAEPEIDEDGFTKVVGKKKR